MAGIGAAAITAGANIVGGLLSRSGQAGANRMNLKIAREQMEFQRKMSSTAMQRAAIDAERAGLNRLLALPSPASTPVGARATMQNPEAALEKGISQAAASALAYYRGAQEVRNMRAQETFTNAQEDLSRAHEDVAKEDIELKRQQKRESIQRQVLQAAQSSNVVTNTALTAQRIPSAAADAELWKTLSSVRGAEEFAKAAGLSVPVARSILMGIRLLRGGKQ